MVMFWVNHCLFIIINVLLSRGYEKKGIHLQNDRDSAPKGKFEHQRKPKKSSIENDGNVSKMRFLNFNCFDLVGQTMKNRDLVGLKSKISRRQLLLKSRRHL